MPSRSTGSEGRTTTTSSGSPSGIPARKIFHLEINYRSTPQIVAFTSASIAHNQSGFPKDAGLGACRRAASRWSCRPADAYEEAGIHLPADPRSPRQGPGARADGRTLSQPSRQHRASGRAAGARDPLHGAQRAAVLRAGPHQGCAGLPADRASTRATRRPGGDCCSSCRASVRPRRRRSSSTSRGAADPLEALETAETMALLPAKSKGFFAGFVSDLRQLRATDPERNPAAAIGAILKGGYPDTVRSKYERPGEPDRRHRAVRPAGREVRQPGAADRRAAAGRRRLRHGLGRGRRASARSLVLSTVHQAKGLEWSHVFIPRLIEESFPHRRPLDEPGGEEEERRIFYVAITRAMNELTLTYPLDHPSRRPGPDRLHHAQPIPHRDRRSAGRAGGDRSRTIDLDGQSMVEMSRGGRGKTRTESMDRGQDDPTGELVMIDSWKLVPAAGIRDVPGARLAADGNPPAATRMNRVAKAPSRRHSSQVFRIQVVDEGDRTWRPAGRAEDGQPDPICHGQQRHRGVRRARPLQSQGLLHRHQPRV